MCIKLKVTVTGVTSITEVKLFKVIGSQLIFDSAVQFKNLRINNQEIKGFRITSNVIEMTPTKISKGVYFVSFNIDDTLISHKVILGK